MPAAWMIARLCREFKCLPSEAERELARQPVGWLEEVMEARAYAECHHLWHTARKKSDVPDSPLMQTVKEIDFELAAEARAAREAEATDG